MKNGQHLQYFVEDEQREIERESRIQLRAHTSATLFRAPHRNLLGEGFPL
jgi:hypothetical protein